MVESYVRLGMLGPATFSLFVRPSPARPWLLAAGLGAALDVLDDFAYGPEELEYLRSQGVSSAALEYLEELRPIGELWGVPDGTIVLGNEPLLEFTAPLPVAQLLESSLMNVVHFDTLVATKAARLTLAARGRPIIDFGLRRAHGLETATRAALAAYLGGAVATSNVEAGRRHGIPISGTMAHSFVQAFEREADAFREFARDHPGGTTLLVDTYDTLQGVASAIDVIRELLPRGIRVRALRLDSEPLAELAIAARQMLDAAALHSVGLFASGGLDEASIADLLAAGAPFDGFGVGSSLVCSSDKPSLDIAYKLVDYAGRGRLKLSRGKTTLPGRKQIFRQDSPESDELELRNVAGPSGQPLLQPLWRNGHRLWDWKLEPARSRARESIAALPKSWQDLEPLARPPEPRLGTHLAALATELEQRIYDRSARAKAGLE